MSTHGPSAKWQPTSLRSAWWGHSGPDLLTLSFSHFDPLRTLPLRHPGHSHALNRPVTPSKEGRIVAPCISGITKAANGEAWIERKSRLHGGPRFVQLPEPRQRS